MSEIIYKNYAGIVMIVEDDVKFVESANKILYEAFDAANIDNTKPILLRMERRKKHLSGGNRFVKGESIMSNACFAINKLLAESFLSNLKKIETTSDIYIHNILPKRDKNIITYNLSPCIANQLSFTKIPSEIHPKGINEEDRVRKQKHISRANNENEYKKLLEQWTS